MPGKTTRSIWQQLPLGTLACLLVVASAVPYVGVSSSRFGATRALLHPSIKATPKMLAPSMSYNETVLHDHPSLYYRLGESPSSTTALDSSVNGLNGSYGSAATLGLRGAIIGDSNTAVSGNGTGPLVRKLEFCGLAVWEFTEDGRTVDEDDFPRLSAAELRRPWSG